MHFFQGLSSADQWQRVSSSWPLGWGVPSQCVYQRFPDLLEGSARPRGHHEHQATAPGPLEKPTLLDLKASMVHTSQRWDARDFGLNMIGVKWPK